MPNLALLLATLAAAVPPPPPIGMGTSSPPIVTTSGPLPGSLRIVTFDPGTARCGGEEQRPVLAELPFPAGTMIYREEAAPAPIRIRFSIDQEGRPLGITPTQPVPLVGRDVAPALAAWRFEPGAARQDCEISFTLRSQAVEDADPALLHRYLALVHPRQPGFNAAVGRAAFERTRLPGSTCFDPTPAVRQRVYPAFETIPQPLGTSSYTFLGFDIDARGRPTNARVLSSSGNEALDRQSLDAVSRSRFAPDARQGCSYFYYRTSSDAMEAPPPPAPEAFGGSGPGCPSEGAKWAEMPPLVFPTNFQRRNIEGWAVIGYDLAPWGAVGNVRVLKAEPAAEFGDHAKGIVQRARRPASDAGATGCVTRVVYKLPQRPNAPGDIEE